MKNKLSLLLVLMILSSATSQVSAQYKSVVLGVKVAPNLGWVKAGQDNYSSDGVRPGFSWGLISDFYFAENYAISTGFNFNFQNGKLTYPEIRNNIIGSQARNYRFKYLEIPALIKMKTNEISGFKIYGLLGGGLSVRLSSKAKDVYTAPGEPTETTDFRIIDSQTTLFKVSMIIGAGVEYELSNGSSLMAGLNFNNGLTNALKGKNVVDASVEHNGVPNFLELNLAFIF